MLGNAGDDNINGTDAEDTLYGGEGNDRILSAGGNDTLFGDSGDDYLEGGAGDDSYIVSEENRNYTIQFNDGKKYIIKLSDDGNSPSLEVAE